MLASEQTAWTYVEVRALKDLDAGTELLADYEWDTEDWPVERSISDYEQASDSESVDDDVAESEDQGEESASTEH